MLTNKQKSHLKSLANNIRPNYQIGKYAINDTSIDMLDKALEAHELIKVNVLKTAGDELGEMSLDLSADLRCDVVQVLGRIITLYRKNPKKQGIRFD